MDSRIIEFLRSDQCESVATVNVVNHSGEWRVECGEADNACAVVCG